MLLPEKTAGQRCQHSKTEKQDQTHHLTMILPQECASVSVVSAFSTQLQKQRPDQSGIKLLQAQTLPVRNCRNQPVDQKPYTDHRHNDQADGKHQYRFHIQKNASLGMRQPSRNKSGMNKRKKMDGSRETSNGENEAMMAPVAIWISGNGSATGDNLTIKPLTVTASSKIKTIVIICIVQPEKLLSRPRKHPNYHSRRATVIYGLSQQLRQFIDAIYKLKEAKQSERQI
jgi:hypothetical protein